MSELVDLVVVDQVAALDHGVRAQRPDRARGAREHLRGKRLLRTEGRLKRRPEAIEERHPRRRGRVEHVGVGDVRERSQAARSAGDARRARCARSVRSPGPGRRSPVPPGSAQVAVERRPGWRCRARAAAAAAGGEQRRRREHLAERLAPGDQAHVDLQPSDHGLARGLARNPEDGDGAREREAQRARRRSRARSRASGSVA